MDQPLLAYDPSFVSILAFGNMLHDRYARALLLSHASDLPLQGHLLYSLPCFALNYHQNNASTRQNLVHTTLLFRTMLLFFFSFVLLFFFSLVLKVLKKKVLNRFVVPICQSIQCKEIWHGTHDNMATKTRLITTNKMQRVEYATKFIFF